MHEEASSYETDHVHLEPQAARQESRYWRYKQQQHSRKGGYAPALNRYPQPTGAGKAQNGGGLRHLEKANQVVEGQKLPGQLAETPAQRDGKGQTQDKSRLLPDGENQQRKKQINLPLARDVPEGPV